MAAMIPTILFVAGSLFFLRISWKALHNPASHGFYRFFIFESILLLGLLNYRRWFEAALSPPQLLSWGLLFTSLFIVLQAVAMLRKRGGYDGREEMPENLPFENTVRVVDEGIYAYIRHPMYTSLLFLAWGIYLKGVTATTTLLMLVATLAAIVAALIEEKENIRFFGSAYRRYMRRTRRFVPWII
mgnify:CR=1 FL=1